MQRIAIARAILKNANIVIMDEASAAADPENEYELQQAFQKLMSGKTVIMIAHRLSSIQNVDQILFVQNGKVVEQGTHNELMACNGRYNGFSGCILQGKSVEVGMMKTYLKRAFQLSDSGVKGLAKSIWSFFLYYVSFVPPMICVFLFADRLLNGNTGKPVVYLLFMLAATLVMYLVINYNYKNDL